ncbi:hypothetical protein ES707_04864 [subsurface metagenome]
MDIRSWPLDKIMQLPDCCFGRRWPVGVYAAEGGIGQYYDISEAGLGDRCVVWQVTYAGGGNWEGVSSIALALGDVLPAGIAEFDALQPLFSDLGKRGAVRRAVDIGSGGVVITLQMRLPVHAQGRRIVALIEITAAEATGPQAILVVSSIPTEVPEWLISGQGSYR